jgi:hypothetical protein
MLGMREANTQSVGVMERVVVTKGMITTVGEACLASA